MLSPFYVYVIMLSKKLDQGRYRHIICELKKYKWPFSQTRGEPLSALIVSIFRLPWRTPRRIKHHALPY